MLKPIFPYKGLFDSHAHLSLIVDDISSLVKSAQEQKVSKIVDVANDVDSAKKVLENKKKFPNVLIATAGIHPELVVPGSDMFEEDLNEEKILNKIYDLDKLIEGNRQDIEMIGETGLDYYWLEKSNLPISQINKSKELQKHLFKGHLELAQKFNLPLTIHARASYFDTIELVKKYPQVRGIFHSFTDSLEFAKEVLDMGFGIGINGIITYKSAQSIRDSLITLTKGKSINSPEDLYSLNIFLETDSPFLILSTVKDRPKYNSPQYISLLWEFVYNLVRS